jgi:hypothetical protein
MDVKITSVIIGVFLGSLLSWIGHVFKTRAETKAKVNAALFHLLEIWSVICVAKVINEDKFSEKLINEIKEAFPKENITPEIEAEIKDGLEQSMPIWLGVRSGTEPKYLSKYMDAVNELASVYPIYAYELNKNQMVINFLDGFEVLFKGKEVAEHEKAALKNMKAFLSNDAFSEFQTDLRKLSKKSGILNYLRVRKHIKKIDRRLNSIPKKHFKDYIDKVIAPIIQAHYDHLGVKNPNLA